MMLRVLDLFSGIGGFSLGLERTGGFKTVAFCEIDPFCRRVLAKHWPEVACYDDVRTVTARQLIAAGIIPDAIAAGFPCQDISSAGLGAGLSGERSGLFFEIIRLIREFAEEGHPIDLVLLENVSALLARGFGDVLGALAEVGFDAWWDCLSASAVGAPHRRDRVWVVAYSSRQLLDRSGETGPTRGHEPANGGCGVAYAESLGLEEQRLSAEGRQMVAELAGSGGRGGNACGSENWWAVEPDVGRVAHGISARVDRLKALGNAVVPQIPELIGRAILASLEERKAAA